jgi:hypothetical protein
MGHLLRLPDEREVTELASRSIEPKFGEVGFTRNGELLTGEFPLPRSFDGRVPRMRSTLRSCVSCT